MTRILGVAMGQRLFNLVRPGAFALHTLPMNRVRRKFGLASLGPDLHRVYTDADHTLYADLPELVPLHSASSEHCFIGPVLWSPHVPLPEWWDRLPRNRPSVYVTLGSSGSSDLLPLALNALADLELNVLVATADRINPVDIPGNAYVAPFLPGTEAAARSSLVLCNGGSPTSYQGLAAGVPVIGIASNLDQYLNMHYVVRAGAGLLMRAGAATEQLLRQTVTTALGASSLAARAKQLQTSIQNSRQANRFPALVEAVLGATKRPRRAAQ